jgi:hypothetical protein
MLKECAEMTFLNEGRLYPTSVTPKKPMYVIRSMILIFRDRIRKRRLFYHNSICCIFFYALDKKFAV